MTTSAGIVVVVSADTERHTYPTWLDGRYVGLVFRVDRGEPHHVQNEAHHSEQIWFYRADRGEQPVGPYPSYQLALDVLVDDDTERNR